MAIEEESVLAQHRPRAVPGFQASPYDGPSRYIVKDATQAHFMLTNAVGVRVLELADGQRSLAEIAAVLSADGKGRLPLQRLTQFFDEGSRLRLIDAATWRSAVGTRPPAKARRFIHIDPVLAWLDAHRRWWLNPVTKLAALALVLLAVVQLCMFPQGGGLLAPLRVLTFTPLDAMMVLLPLIFIGEMVLHEFAHAIACHACGARTRGFAFKLMWGVFPTVVTDTFDAHSIANKYHRMFVSFAGPMVNIISFGLVMTAYRTLDPSSFLAHMLLAYAGLSLMTIVFTLNPFLVWMDGYWIAADFLGQPNLHKVAMAHLRAGLGRLPGLRRLRKPGSNYSMRSTLVYSLYAAVAFTWTGCVVARFVYELGHFWPALHQTRLGF